MNRNSQPIKVLVCAPLSFGTDEAARAGIAEIAQFAAGYGGRIVDGSARYNGAPGPENIHFYYMPDLSEDRDIIRESNSIEYDAVIAAAGTIPAEARFRLAGVRIGTGTSNMQSESWGGIDGRGGNGVLMNTPGINARATAQIVLKTLLSQLPDLEISQLHYLTVNRKFDTKKHLSEYSSSRLDGKRASIAGFGHIGRIVADYFASLGLSVTVFARPSYRPWIESKGYRWCETLAAAAAGADILSIHVGLGKFDAAKGAFANANLIDESIISALSDGAILINFDRAELVDKNALEKAMSAGTLSFAAIDADIFLDSAGNANGPLSPFLPIAHTFPDRILLLPHAAADTDKRSRMDGAKLAIRLISELARNSVAYNVVGDTPAGIIRGGILSSGHTASNTIETFHEFTRMLDKSSISGDINLLSKFIENIKSTNMNTNRFDPIEFRETVLSANRIITFLNTAGLTGFIESARY